MFNELADKLHFLSAVQEKGTIRNYAKIKLSILTDNQKPFTIIAIAT